ncbi:MAG: malonic semialdehyde reductase [Micavibrio sp.]
MNSGKIMDDSVLDHMFREARTHKAWQKKDVSPALLKALYDLLKMGPTAANCCPARFVFIATDEGRERLKPHLDKGNVEKTMSAPVTAIVAYDTQFYEFMPELFPHAPSARSWYEGKPQVIEENCMRNSSLQGAYMIMAARSLGLDCGPMGGFNKDTLNAEFFPDGRYKANFLCNLGYGDPAALQPRLPRLGFDQVCQVL